MKFNFAYIFVALNMVHIVSKQLYKNECFKIFLVIICGQSESYGKNIIYNIIIIQF